MTLNNFLRNPIHFLSYYFSCYRRTRRKLDSTRQKNIQKAFFSLSIARKCTIRFAVFCPFAVFCRLLVWARYFLRHPKGILLYDRHPGAAAGNIIIVYSDFTFNVPGRARWAFFVCVVVFKTQNRQERRELLPPVTLDHTITHVDANSLKPPNRNHRPAALTLLWQGYTTLYSTTRSFAIAARW